ncbi:Uncharacterized protein with protein kinase and helix-hairpin-helix DNA-binding domains-like protein [Pedosphaera parvula Ellin514]|uniref:Uncharacterized protein with protein kinase and helix-hairpin-helix DNA-binding domains-like protein n=2 Tax=Pedosphaera TaxID=1032526 RepID=B9XNU7_PEDPL|nr:Uncharacterized protein with protein kinase and helix-hairpin-helix DNA-binding domains-like protein [Pedosphaera parvula Ellin514]
MNEVYDESGRMLPLGDQFASGGEGVLYRLKDTETLCVKVYHEKPDVVQTRKLKLLRSRAEALSKVAALPKSLLFADADLSKVVGILIPFVRGHEIHDLYGTRARLHHFPKASFRFMAHVAYNLAHVFDELHCHEIVIGDISEQNVKVLPDATVRLIDCDSFQVADEGTVYTSDVGTPLWTPPELQGKNLVGLHRDVNHDLFGLAQLIFLLCFAGRHPFAGVPRGGKQLTPEAAIGEFAFAFAPKELGLPLAPPPGCPALTALPGCMQELFMRAFLKGSEAPKARPQAAEWKECLEELLKNLTACANHSGHIFWKKAVECPWCSVMRETEVDLFPFREEHTSDTSMLLKEADFITRLRSIRPHPFAIEPLPVFADLAPEALPSEPAGLWNSLQKTVALGGWKKNWLSTALDANQKALAEAEASLQSAPSQQMLVADYNREFSKLHAVVLPMLRMLSRPGHVRRDIEGDLAGDRKKYQMQEFLDDLLLRDALVSGVGLGDKTMLQSHGIETTADITEAALAKIAGLGETQVLGLLAWRKTCEGIFKYDASKPMSNSLRQEIERRVQERLEKLKEEALACERKFGELQTLFNARLRLVQAQLAQLARQREQARVNIAFLQEQLGME